MIVRTLVDSEDPADIEKVNAIQQEIKVVQKSAGKFNIPNRDRASKTPVREWPAAQTLPFPAFADDYRQQITDTQDYPSPSEGSPGADLG